jgi:predicted NUDIX family NTP pyrophosphohydrolase
MSSSNGSPQTDEEKMKTTRKLMMTAALLAFTLGVIPTASALAQNRPDDMRGTMQDGMRGDCQGGKFDHGRFDMKKGGFDGYHNKMNAMRRDTALSVDEARLLMDAMLLRHGDTDLKTGKVVASKDGAEIMLEVVNAKGDLVTDMTFDAFTGRPDRGEFRELRRMMGKPDRKNRYDNKYSTAQMEMLTKAMILMRGNGDLVLGKLTETDRGTYMATITNKSGDVVREIELSRVTARPINGGPAFGGKKGSQRM